MIINRAHKIRIDANKADEQFFMQCIGTARFAYNWAFSQWQDIYRLGGQPSEMQLRRNLNHIKKEAFPWMYDVPKSIPQQAIKNLGNGYSRFFKKLGRYPKRKHRKDGRQSCRLDNGPSTIKLKGNKVYISNHGWVKLFEPLRWDSCKPLSLTLKKDGKRWFLVVSAEINIPDQPDDDNQVIRDGAGDVGLASSLTYGDETNITKLVAPKPLKWYMNKLKRYSKKVSGSVNQAKAKIRLNDLHYRIRCIREDWQHKTSNMIAKEYDVFYMEDLNIKGMMSNHCVAGSIADEGWGELKRQIKYKTYVVEVGRWFPSSKLCNCCHHKQPLTLNDRSWVCDVCGTEHDRDGNAVLTILEEGRRIITTSYAVYSYIGKKKFVPAVCREVTPLETGSLVRSRDLIKIAVGSRN